MYKLNGKVVYAHLAVDSITYVKDYRVEIAQLKNGYVAHNGALGTFYGTTKEQALEAISAQLNKQ